MRFHYFDAMRSILMILGVLLHAANVYAVHGHWQVHDPQTHAVFDTISETIHIFRMPALFMISGFFAQMTFEKHGRRSFLSLRLRRLLIPLVSTALLCNTVQIWLRLPAGCAPAASVSEFFTVTLPCAVQQGDWIQHLWFLVVVLIYCVCCIPLASILKSTRRTHSEHKSASDFRIQQSILFAAPVLTVVIATVQHFAPVLQGAGGPYFWGLVEPAYLLGYLPFFAFGMWLFTQPNVLRGFSHFGVMTIAAGLMIVALQQLLATTSSGTATRTLNVYQTALQQWLGCHLCFCVFQRFFNQPSGFFTYLSDASYSIYLFHHLAIVAAAGLLLQLTVSVFLKFAIVVTLAGVFPVGVHELLIRRIALLRMMFNGK